MKKELREVLDAAKKRVRAKPDYLLSPEVKKELLELEEIRRRSLTRDRGSGSRKCSRTNTVTTTNINTNTRR